VMVASGVKMRHARGIIDGIEQASPSSRLFPGAGYRMRRGGRIIRDGG
jgi:hypothetical protein